MTYCTVLVYSSFYLIFILDYYAYYLESWFEEWGGCTS